MVVIAPDYDPQASKSKVPGRGCAEFEGRRTPICSHCAHFSPIPDVTCECGALDRLVTCGTSPVFSECCPTSLRTHRQATRHTPSPPMPCAPPPPYLCVEHLMLHHVKVHREEPGLQRSAERVPLHQANLRVGRLVSEQMLLGWDHILEDLEQARWKHH